MSHLKHAWKVAVVGAALAGVFYFNATTHKTTQAAAPVAVQAVATPAVEMMPIHGAESSGGGGDLSAMNKTD